MVIREGIEFGLSLFIVSGSLWIAYGLIVMGKDKYGGRDLGKNFDHKADI